MFQFHFSSELIIGQACTLQRLHLPSCANSHDNIQSNAHGNSQLVEMGLKHTLECCSIMGFCCECRATNPNQKDNFICMSTSVSSLTIPILNSEEN